MHCKVSIPALACLFARRAASCADHVYEHAACKDHVLASCWITMCVCVCVCVCAGAAPSTRILRCELPVNMYCVCAPCVCRGGAIHQNTEVWSFAVIAMEVLYEATPWSRYIRKLIDDGHTDKVRGHTFFPHTLVMHSHFCHTQQQLRVPHRPAIFVPSAQTHPALTCLT